MAGELEFAAFSLLIPGGAAALACWVGIWLLPESEARYAFPLAAAGGFVLGYALLPDWAPLAPARHWQWLPYLCGPAVLGAIGLARGVHACERWLLWAWLAVVCAWQLVPAWESLRPSRLIWIGLFTAYLLLLIAALDSLPQFLLGAFFGVWQTFVLLFLAVAVAIEVSLKFGQLGAIAASTFVGCWFAALFFARPSSERASLGPMLARGSIPLFGVLAGGLAFVGCIEPQPPLYPLLLMPAAPLALWLFAAGPLAKLRGAYSALAQAVAVGAVLLLAAALLLLRGQDDEWTGPPTIDAASFAEYTKGA